MFLRPTRRPGRDGRVFVIFSSRLRRAPPVSATLSRSASCHSPRCLLLARQSVALYEHRTTLPTVRTTTGIGFNISTPPQTLHRGGYRVGYNGKSVINRRLVPRYKNAKTLSHLQYYTVIYVTTDDPATERGLERIQIIRIARLLHGVIFRLHASKAIMGCKSMC